MTITSAEQEQREAMIAGDWDGIYAPHEAFYIHSLIYAADRAADAFRRFDGAVKDKSPPALIVATIQEALTHAAAASRFFWPMGKSALTQARGQKLRAAFAVDDSSPLRHRRLRNAFEHFDEDLDRFLLEDRVGYFFPTPLVDDHAIADDELGNIFKLVDPVRHVCVLLGQKYNYGSIRRELERVLADALTMDENGCRLTRNDAPPAGAG